MADAAKRPARKRRRGLGSLLSRTIPGPGSGRDDPTDPGNAPADGALVHVPVDRIDPNIHQPRIHFDEEDLKDLTDSIRVNGMLQPLVAVPRDDGRYELIAGERRLRAAKAAGMENVPVLVRIVDELEMLGLSLLENIQRDDLNPIEAARGYRKLIDLFHLRQEEIAEKIGKSRSSVANTLRLLELPEPVRKAVESGTLSAGHARALLALPTASLQADTALKAILNGWSVRQLEDVVYGNKRKQKRGADKEPAAVSPHIRSLQDTLSERFGTRVTIDAKKDRGRVVIEFYSNDDFERILDVLGIT